MARKDESKRRARIPPPPGGGGAGGGDTPAPAPAPSTAPAPSGGGSTSTAAAPSGGSPKGTGKAAATKKVTKKDYAAFLLRAQQLDLQLTPGIRAMARKAAQNDWTASTFEYFLHNTKTYKRRFRGMPREMTPDQYLDAEAGYLADAREMGIGLGRKELIDLISKRVSTDEFKFRAQAVQRAAENAEFFAYFNGVLQQQGMEPLDKVGQIFFTMGKAPQAFMDLFERVSLAFAASKAGLQEVTLQDIERLQALEPERFQEGEAAAFFTDLAERVRRDVPLSRLAGFGVTERDIVEMELYPTDPRAMETARRIGQATANLEVQARQTAGTMPLPGAGQAPRKRQATQ